MTVSKNDKRLFLYPFIKNKEMEICHIGKGKSRKNPNKPQNRYGDFCQYYEESGGEHGHLNVIYSK